MTARDVVLKAIAEAAMTDTERLVDSMTLEGDLHLDDLALSEIVLEVEEALSVEIPGYGFGNWHTIGDVVAEVERIAP